MRERRTSPATGAKYEDARWAGGMRAAPVGGMRNHLHQPVVEHAVEAITLARPLVEAVTRRDRELGSQLRRALSSVALNLAEGWGSQGGNARLRYESARGSVYEARAALHVAIAWGYVSAENAFTVLESLDALGGRVFGLVRR